MSKKIKVLVNYANDSTFSDQAKCKASALAQIARGSHVIFQVAGQCGLGALDAAKTKHVWGIGVDADQYFLGTHMLTSALKRVDAAVYDTIKEYQANPASFKGGIDKHYTLKNGGVGYGRLSPKLPAAVRKQLVASTNALEKLDHQGQGQASDTVARLLGGGALASPPQDSLVPADAPVLELRGITKRFPGVVANDHVDLELERREVHALLGENGAGKSTLMNVLYGLYRPDEGEILLTASGSSSARRRTRSRAGIGMVHQHFMLIPVMTVAENIVLGDGADGGGVLLDYGEANERVAEIAQHLRARDRPRTRSSRT